MKSFKSLVEGLQVEGVEIKPSEFHAVRTGKKTAEQLAAEKKKPVGTVKGELNLHADHWSKGEDHYNKLFKEETEQVDEMFENLPGKATHLTNKDVHHPEHGIIAGSTTLRHVGGDKYEVRAGRAKGKTIDLDKQHVQKMSEETQQQGDSMSMMEQYLAAIAGKTDFRTQLEEKTLTPAEMKKREEVAQAIERENPDMDMSKKMAIATSTAKKVAEETVEEQTHPKTDKEKDLAKMAPPHNKITHADVMVGRGVKKEEAGASKDAEDKFHTKLDKLVHTTFGKRKAEMQEMSSKEKMKRGLYNKEEAEVDEELKGNQHKLDKNKNGKLDAHDFKLLRKEEVELTESHFKVGDEVVCKASGMEGEVVKVDPKEEGKYYTVKREDGKMVNYAPDELKLDEQVQVSEAMISYSDFMGKIQAHRKAGNKIVDDKYTDKKAEYTSVDGDGYGRKVTHTHGGQKMENLGQVEKRDEKETTTEKRGRGRPAGSKSGARN